MSIIVSIMTDGRGEYMEATMASLSLRVSGDINRFVIHDDSGDVAYRRWLEAQFRDCFIIGDGDRSGFCGAYQSCWKWLAEYPGSEPWVFQLEDDFTFETDIDLNVLVSVMEAQPHIAQMQLRRQPWWTEPEDGGFIGQWPHFYTDRDDGAHHWLEHQRNWSTNPGLFRREICERGWPDPPGCEGTFGDQLMGEDPAVVFAVWGQREDPPTVRHIGTERIGHSY